MSSLTVTTEPWVALPSPETTIAEISQALIAFPDLRIHVGDELDVSLVLAHRRATPPRGVDLAEAMFGSDPDLLVAVEHSGVHELASIEEMFDVEAQDRNAEGV